MSWTMRPGESLLYLSFLRRLTHPSSLQHPRTFIMTSSPSSRLLRVAILPQRRHVVPTVTFPYFEEGIALKDTKHHILEKNKLPLPPDCLVLSESNEILRLPFPSLLDKSRPRVLPRRGMPSFSKPREGVVRLCSSPKRLSALLSGNMPDKNKKAQGRAPFINAFRQA
ncbi:hypothetical protein FRC02_005580, partial [Tulasnella sp. 418]